MNPLDDPKVKQQVQILSYTRIFGYILMLVGFALLVWNAGWLITIGALLLIAGNNSLLNANTGLALLKLTAVLIESFDLRPKKRDYIDEAAEMLKRAHAEMTRGGR